LNSRLPLHTQSFDGHAAPKGANPEHALKDHLPPLSKLWRAVPSVKNFPKRSDMETVEPHRLIRMDH
jgi:hypothetical protein